MPNYTKRVKCPRCQHEHTVKGTGQRHPVQRPGENDITSLILTCEKCLKPFQFLDDPNDTGTLPVDG